MKKFLPFIIFVSLFQFVKAVTVEIDGVCYNIDTKNGVAEVEANPYHIYADSIFIPEKVSYQGKEYKVTSVGEMAFFCCDRVLAVTMPNSISSIGHAAFWGCQSLDSIKIPEQVTEIVYDLFADCENLRRVDLPDGITFIGNSAFNCCFSLDSLHLPDAVETIEDWAFTSCKSLSSIEIPTKLSEVGRGAFADCPSMTSVQISDLSAWCKINFADATANPLNNTHKLIVNGEEITNLVIPGDVTSIGKCAFYPCQNLTSLTIGSQVEQIGDWAFYQCWHLTSVICYPRKVPYMSREVFSNNIMDNSTLYVASSAASAYQKAEPWSRFQEMVSLDLSKFVLSYYVDGELYSIYTIEEGAYITPEPAVEKEGYTFSGWSKIPETMPSHDVIVEGTLTLTSMKLLSNGINYTLWVIPQTAEITGLAPNDAFSGILSIPSTVSKDGKIYDVTTIGNAAFTGCSNLVSVNIPESVTSIGNEAFQGCMLQNVFAKNAKIQFDGNAFSQATYNHAVLYVPTGKWEEAVYQGSLWHFTNIRETATEESELSPSQAYTLMDTDTYGYVVYDMVNDDVKTIKAFHHVDESSPNNCWQIVKLAEKEALYNIGAKKYAMLNADGKMTLSVTPTPLNMENGENGIFIGNDTQTQWNFVQNANVNVDPNVVGIESVTNNVAISADCYYLSNGLQTNVSGPGVVIIKQKDGRTKKVLKH